MLKKSTWDTRAQPMVPEQSQGTARAPHSEQMPKFELWAAVHKTVSIQYPKLHLKFKKTINEVYLPLTVPYP